MRNLETRVHKGEAVGHLGGGKMQRKTVYIPQYKVNACWMNFPRFPFFEEETKANEYIEMKKREAEKKEAQLAKR